MSDPKPADSPTIRLHKRQFLWQILLPIVLVVLLALIVGGLTVVVSLGNASQARLWADISLIWLLLPVILLALGVAAVLGAVIYGMARLLQVIPVYTKKVHGIVARVSTAGLKVADGATKPFIWFHQIGAVLKSLFKK